MDSIALSDLSHRRRRPERMDQPGLDAREHADALRALGRVNLLSRSAAILWPEIARLAREREGTPVRVLDLASGGGDVPIALARRAGRSGLDIRIEGCDISPEAVAFAARQARSRGVEVSFFAHDALGGPLPGEYDVVTSSLFLHHLDEPDAVLVLRRMADAARALVLVNDLVRSRRGYLLAWLGCRLLSRSPIVHHDGPISVAGAFDLDEVAALIDRAGLHGASVARRWPERFLLAWRRR